MKLMVLGGPAAGFAGLPEDASEPAPTGRRGAVALSDGGPRWLLLNVAPNVAEQLQSDGSLRCHASLGNGGPRSIVLTDAQVDHVSGLLSLRHGGPIDLYITPAVFEVLSQSMPVLQVLQHHCGVHWRVIPVAGETLSASFRVDGLERLEFTALATEGPAPPYLPEHESAATTGLTIALAVRDTLTGQRLFCAPGAQTLSETGLDWMLQADCVMVDDHTHWPEASPELPSPSWRAQRKLVFSGAQTATPRASTDGFERAYSGMFIEF